MTTTKRAKKRGGVELLFDIDCRRATERCNDGGGLFLLVEKDDAAGEFRKYWRYKYRFQGRERLAGLGTYPATSLANARAERDRMRDILKTGVDPIAADRADAAKKKAEKLATERQSERTLEGFARAHHARLVKAGKFTNPKHQAQWLSSLAPVFKELGARELHTITKHDLIRALAPIFERTPESGKRIRQRVHSIFSAAMFEDHVTANPAGGLASEQGKLALGESIRKNGDTPHLRALKFSELPGLVRAIDVSERSGLSVRLCMLFAVACAARSGEARLARWSEIDRAAGTWTLGPKRTKQRQQHIVALSSFALRILDEAEALRDPESDDPLIFPSPSDPRVELSDMALTAALRRLATGSTKDDGEPETYGDLTVMHTAARSSFSTWANDSGARSVVVEACLGHKEADLVKAAYDRSRSDGEKFRAEMARLFERWGRFASGDRHARKVVPLHAGGQASAVK